jgi:predicted nucleic acid-binding protein
VAKCYLNETDGVAVRELARSASGLYSSSLCIAELACVFHRHHREGVLTASAVAALRDLFLDDLENQVWNLISVTDRLFRRVESLVRTVPKHAFVRAGDAIHLVSAAQAGFDEIWTNDRHLLAAAQYAGLKGRSVSNEIR